MGPEEGDSHNSEQAATNMDVDVMAGSLDTMDIVSLDVASGMAEMNIGVQVGIRSRGTFGNSITTTETGQMPGEVPDGVSREQATVQMIPIEARERQ